MSAPAGWYHDATGVVRWWDGYRWGAAAPAATGPVTPPQVAPGTRTNTVWIWLVVLLPLAQLLLLIPTFADLQRTMTDMFASIPLDGSQADPQAVFTAEMAIFTSPWYVIVSLLGWAIYGLSVWFAYLDRRELSRRGFVRPFHWAWMFLSGWVYVIGRTVVIGRRGGRGAAPLWVFIAIQVVTFIVVMVWTVSLMQSIMSGVMTSIPTS